MSDDSIEFVHRGTLIAYEAHTGRVLTVHDVLTEQASADYEIPEIRREQVRVVATRSFPDTAVKVAVTDLRLEGDAQRYRVDPISGDVRVELDHELLAQGRVTTSTGPMHPPFDVED